MEIVRFPDKGFPRSHLACLCLIICYGTCLSYTSDQIVSFPPFLVWRRMSFRQRPFGGSTPPFTHPYPRATELRAASLWQSWQLAVGFPTQCDPSASTSTTTVSPPNQSAGRTFPMKTLLWPGTPQKTGGTWKSCWERGGGL